MVGGSCTGTLVEIHWWLVQLHICSLPTNFGHFFGTWKICENMPELMYSSLTHSANVRGDQTLENSENSENLKFE